MYLWADKYRPRKPRFFNRVHTGFEWNKYNQTHYDFDNPPPKIVQGYKFNIFYPDLIDKRSTPQYFLEPCPDNKDFGILRFHAGPPYEDIAFKIVNREWEYSHRHGFRCQFANGIFQLWFHFKRYRYRRWRGVVLASVDYQEHLASSVSGRTGFHQNRPKYVILSLLKIQFCIFSDLQALSLHSIPFFLMILLGELKCYSCTICFWDDTLKIYSFLIV